VLSDDAAGDVSARLVVPGVEDGAAESVRLAPGRTWELASDDPVPLELVLRRSAGEDPPLAEPAVTWGGRPLTRAPVLRVVTERGDPWPEDAGEPVVDVEHEQGRWLRVRVPGTRDGQQVRVLVALTPPADLPEPPRVRDERGVERSAPLACREVHELVGTTPLSFSVRKLSTEALALSVALDGVQVPARAQRYRGRRASRADELRLFVPAWQPGVSPADCAAEHDADVAAAGPAAGEPGEVHLTPWYPVGVPPRRDPSDLRAPPPGHRELLRRLPRTE
jgi:hypothetical protein